AVERQVAEEAHGLVYAEAAAEAAGAAGVLPQRVLLDEHRVLGLGGLGRGVVGVAVVDADDRAHAVAVVFRAVAAAGQAADTHAEPPGAWDDAVAHDARPDGVMGAR